MRPPFFGSRANRTGAVCMLLLATQLASCGGGSDSPPETGTPPPPSGGNPPPPQPTKVSLKLTGAVTDAPIANAVVTATVGTQTFTATADANGVYSLDIEIDEDDADNFVTLSGRGVGDQSFVEFRSLAGSFQALADAAGTDKTLSSQENFATQITNVSTAEAALLQEANGGQPITSDSALASLGGELDAQNVLDLAAAIKLMVDHADEYPMPAGSTSILALASDLEARQQLIADVSAKDPAAFAEAQNAIVADPDLAQPLSAAAVTDFTSAMLSTDPDFSFNYTNRASSYTFVEDGTGSVSTGSYDAAMTWKVEGSTIRVTFVQPVETVSYDIENCVDDGGVRQVEAHYVTQDVTLAFLSKRTVATTEVSHITYADCASLAARDVTSTTARTILTETDLLPLDVAELRDSTHSIYVFDSATNAVVADIADLKADGTGTTRLTSQSFTWAYDDTSHFVTATFNDGTVAEYGSLREIDEVTSDLYFEIRTPGGAVYTDIGASIYAAPDYAVEFDASDVPGRFYQFGKADAGFRLRFDADGTGAHETAFVDVNGNVVTEDETLVPSHAFHWTLENDAVVVRRTWDVVAEQDGCVFGAPDCELYDERRIIPIAADGDRIYWLEKRRFDFDGLDVSTPATHLVRFYDREPLTGAVVTQPSAGEANAPRATTRILPPGAVQR